MTFLQHIKQVGIAIDQLVNTLLGSYADETVSARVHKLSKRGYWYAKVIEFVLNLIFSPIAHNHCYRAYMSEKNGTQLPPEYRK